MKRFFIILATIFISISVFAQTITYTFDAPNAAHHEAEISIAVDKLPAGPALFRMSRSSPGRYATHEFVNNVYYVKAFDAAGKPLTVEKADADVYKVTNHKGYAKVTYTLFANYADGTYASVDPSGFHLNMPATFMWVKGLDNTPITVHFKLLDANWKIATQLKPSADATTFTAPGLQYFMDSPTKIGDLHFRTWSVTNTDKKPITFRLALDAEATEPAIDSLAARLKRMVNEAAKVYGEFPNYDYGTYTFIASINPYVFGDGMEHRNSTMITSQRNFSTITSLPGVFGHEFFHCWNVERIRPQGIEPFNFEKSNMTSGMWVAEGFTQYYGNLILLRAGLMKEEDFLSSAAGLINTKNYTPGAMNYSPIENSQRAVFVDAGVSIDRTNYENMYSSYYTYGGGIALALDLDLRNKFNNNLDNFMRELWKRHGKTEKPYSISDLQNALAAITNQSYAADFFTKYVYGHEPFDYKSALAKTGLQLTSINDGKANAGPVFFQPGKTELIVANPTRKGSPLYIAGIDEGDVLLTADGKELKQPKDFEDIINSHKEGDNIKVTYKHRNKMMDTNVILQTSKAVKFAALSNSNPDKTQKDFKAGWLGAK